MPTFNQLVRKGREAVVTKSTAPALQVGYNSQKMCIRDRSRDRASFEVRDVHYSHYGRLCPIETPEGPNIGLISYLATYARINDFGFIEAPYRVIEKIKDEETGEVRCHVTDEVRYMTADVEDEYIVCQATEPLDENNNLVNDRVTCRRRDEFVEVDRKDVDLMDVSPRMMISVATAFIPFLDHDDANRALMGANMQRQAVPLLRTEAPIVATGMEYKAAVDSGTIPLAEGDGVVTRVTAREVCVHYDNGTDKTYPLTKFMRSNQSTCINMRPIVDLGERVKAGDVLSDGPSTCLLYTSISSSRMMMSLLRKPAIRSTSAPISCSFLACGYAIAQPRPCLLYTSFRPSVRDRHTCAAALAQH